jgi:ribose/xylose/arabinose/galactoside ABC-type transport system permease subunit
MFLIQTLLDSLNVSSNWLQLIYGMILIVAVVLSAQIRPVRAVAPDTATVVST